MAKEQEPCGCRSCSPLMDETVCNMMAASNARYHDLSSMAAAASLQIQNNMQLQFSVQGANNLEKNPNDQLAANLLGFMAMNQRAGGIPAPA